MPEFDERYGTDGSNTDRPVRPFGDRYDALLSIVPLSFGLAVLASLLLGVPIEVTILPAALISGVAIVDGVYRNPPTAGCGRPS